MFHGRIGRLEARAAQRRRDDEDPPDPTGRPRDVARCEYLEWLREKLDAPALSPEWRAALHDRMAGLTPVIERIAERMRQQTRPMTNEETRILAKVTATLAGVQFAWNEAGINQQEPSQC